MRRKDITKYNTTVRRNNINKRRVISKQSISIKGNP